jgi:surface antigen
MIAHARRLAAVILVATLACGCSGVKKKDVGAVAGGVAGGVAGATIGGSNPTVKTIATIAGVLIGAGIGWYVGGKFDDADRVKTSEVLENNKDNDSGVWRNPNSGNRYSLTPTRTYQRTDGDYCREYNQVAEIEGKKETITGTACRINGRWEIVKAN